ncbi:aminotransferase class III-fold pyridoxal phosphate-dependent enzyme [Mycetohabitans endofungorum]|uniref:aminotransferase class III-fold pyridoxal phosphate-dependent enzyme n=1 Tax=Mycetohabitans endofungorum TaxID=417203 RepID=UPI00396A4F3A
MDHTRRRTAIIESDLQLVCERTRAPTRVDQLMPSFARCRGMQHDDVKPDLITMAKSLVGGMLLSDMVGRAVLTDAAKPGGLGGIYVDHSLVCTAAHAVLEVIVEENLSTRADTLGRQLKKRLEHGLLLLVGSVHGKVIRFLFRCRASRQCWTRAGHT